jgi:hypothetical protein
MIAVVLINVANADWIPKWGIKPQQSLSSWLGQKNSRKGVPRRKLELIPLRRARQLPGCVNLTPKAKLGLCRPALHWQVKSGAQSCLISFYNAPKRLHRHSSVGCVHQVDHASLWIMPQFQFQRFACNQSPNVFGIPMSQSSLAGDWRPRSIGDGDADRFSTTGSVNNARVGHVRFAFGQGRGEKKPNQQGERSMNYNH